MNALARDEVHHSVWCLLDVPHLARLSRLYRGRPRPCSRRLPAAGVIFVFLVEIPNCIFVKISNGIFVRVYKVSLRDVPTGVAQERIEKHTACDFVSYAYDIILRRYEISVL